MLVLKSFDVSIVEVDLAFEQLNQRTKGLDGLCKLFGSLGVTVDLGIQIVDDPRVDPFLAGQIVNKGPVDAREIAHGSWGTDSRRGVSWKL